MTKGITGTDLEGDIAQGAGVPGEEGQHWQRPARAVAPTSLSKITDPVAKLSASRGLSFQNAGNYC